jgi:hypothetical protein
MRSILFLRCGLKNLQSPNSRSLHNWIIEESRKNGAGEFSQEFKKYQVMMVRMTDRDDNLSGPASVLFGSQNSTVNWQDRGVVALRSPYGMRVYPENAQSNFFDHDPFQPYMTAPALCMLYHKYLSAGYELPNRDKGVFNHNETSIAVDDSRSDVAPLVTNVVKIKDARDQMQSSDLLKNTDGDICYYDEKTGVLYSSSAQLDPYYLDLKMSDDQRWGLSEIELPNTVLSLKNMESNRDMFEFVKSSYEYDVRLYAKFMVESILRNEAQENEIEEIRRRKIGGPFLDDLEKGFREERKIVSKFGLGSDLLVVFRDDIRNEMEKEVSGSRISKAKVFKVFDRQDSLSGNSRS